LNRDGGGSKAAATCRCYARRSRPRSGRPSAWRELALRDDCIEATSEFQLRMGLTRGMSPRTLVGAIDATRSSDSIIRHWRGDKERVQYIICWSVNAATFSRKVGTMNRTFVSLILGLLVIPSALPMGTASDQNAFLKRASLIERGIPPNSQAPGWVCVTPYGWCYLQQQQPPGSPCLCFFPPGPARGVTR